MTSTGLLACRDISIIKLPDMGKIGARRTIEASNMEHFAGALFQPSSSAAIFRFMISIAINYDKINSPILLHRSSQICEHEIFFFHKFMCYLGGYWSITVVPILIIDHWSEFRRR